MSSACVHALAFRRVDEAERVAPPEAAVRVAVGHQLAQHLVGQDAKVQLTQAVRVGHIGTQP